ncbi:MAG: hypothetical protein H8Z69_03360 [Nanohaloarchaea archaeon]|nr:hypothetical protein [Candidatus Nanohaloarchaea archaeon]
MTKKFSRRKILGGIGAALTAGAAGCASDGKQKTQQTKNGVNAANSGSRTSSIDHPYDDEVSELESELNRITNNYSMLEEPDVEVTNKGVASVSKHRSEYVKQDRYGINISIDATGELSEFDHTLDEEGRGTAVDYITNVLMGFNDELGDETISGYSDQPVEGDVISQVSVAVEGEEAGRASVNYGHRNPETHIDDMVGTAEQGEDALRQEVENSLAVF